MMLDISAQQQATDRQQSHRVPRLDRRPESRAIELGCWEALFLGLLNPSVKDNTGTHSETLVRIQWNPRKETAQPGPA